MKLRPSLAITAILIGTSLPAIGMEAGWYFSEQEISAAYRYQERFGSRLRHPLKPQACYHGRSEFMASFQGKPFVAPCRFITETTRHLKLMLENGAAHYLFPLDADHAHLSIPRDLWVEKYSKLSLGDALVKLLYEPKLIALYHTAEHVTIATSGTDPAADQTKDWRAKRNVLGVFDGNPVKILPPRADGTGRDRPDHYENVGAVYFLAHRLGEIVFSANGQAVSLDISFDEDSSDVP